MNNNKYISIKYFYEKNNNKILKIIFKRFSSVNNIFPAYPFKLFFNIVCNQLNVLYILCDNFEF
jgi:hypothetical protein